MKTASRALFAALLVFFLAAPLRADDSAIAPFITDTTFLVVRIQPTKIDLNAAESWRQKIFSQADDANTEDPGKAPIAAAMPFIHQGIQALTDAGGGDCYVIGYMALGGNIGVPVALVIPLPAGADSSAIASLLLKNGVSGNDPNMQTATIQGALVYGSSAMIERMKAAKPADRPEVLAALSAGGDAPITVSFIPTFAIKLILGQVPPLKAAGPVISGMSWLTLAANAPPKESLHIAFQARDAASATNTMTSAKTLLDLLRAMPDQASLADALMPVQNDQSLTIDLDTNTVDTKVVPVLVDAVKKARTRAQVVQSASNIRQLLMGCLMYSNDHNAQWPDKLDDLTPEIPNLAQITTNPSRPGVTPGYIYVKPSAPAPQLQSPSTTIVIYEPADGDKMVNIGFADGHVEGFAADKAAEALKDIQKP